MSLGPVLEALREQREIAPRIAHEAFLPPLESRFGRLSEPLPEALEHVLAARGAERLFSHQTEALDALSKERDVLVTTPTASGKSLIFQIPILLEALREGPGHALFLFPLKALGQDQRTKLDEMAAELGLGDVCAIYDGDTTSHRRAKIRRDPPRVVITNPDMLHLGLLGHPAGWRSFFGSLRYVVLDELHTYRGIFGSHFHHVLQRLLRLTRDAGSDPRIIAASATASNAAEFAATLCDREFAWIQESGAPREGRHVLLLRPETSPYTLTLNLFRFCLRQGLKTIVFTKARRITELLYSWLRRRDVELASRVASYRAGFLPSERRGIERDLANGRLDGVISTSALEMGIDIGGLDACILVGYPGSVMATWQRSGRVGRSGRESLTALVAMPDSLDQYLLDHPEVILESPCERLAADPANEHVASAHLVCAAAELPLRREEDRLYLERHAALVDDLLRQGELAETADGEICSRVRQPHRRVSLRGSGATTSIVDESSGRVIGTVDGMRAHQECHAGAIYLHAGRQYAVRSLDLDERKAVAKKTRVEYFTTPLSEKETEILEILDERSDGPLHAWLGRLEVTERVVGYERRNLVGREVLGRHDLDLPPMQFQTVGLYFAAPKEVETLLRDREAHFMGSLHAAEHATIALLPLLALCDRNDLGGISIPFHPQVGSGAVFVYDGHPGGVGIAKRGFEELPDLLGRVADLLEACPCEEGCPACVHSPKCGNGNRPLDKHGARELLELLLERKELGGGATRPVAVEPPGKRRPREEDGPERREAEPPREPAPSEPPTKRGQRSRRGKKRPSFPLPPRPDLPERTVLFDLETLRSADEVGGWNRSDRMGVAVGVVCLLEEGRFEVYREDGVRDLVERLREADLVVGFNVNRFDYRVLQGYIGEDLRRSLPTLDLLDEIYGHLGFRIGLDHLARETLGASKSADGLQSLEWVQQGRFDLVEEYCRHDVEILRDLYLFGRREGYVYYRDKEDRRLKLPVAW